MEAAAKISSWKSRKLHIIWIEHLFKIFASERLTLQKCTLSYNLVFWADKTLDSRRGCAETGRFSNSNPRPPRVNNRTDWIHDDSAESLCLFICFPVVFSPLFRYHCTISIVSEGLNLSNTQPDPCTDSTFVLQGRN